MALLQYSDGLFLGGTRACMHQLPYQHQEGLYYKYHTPHHLASKGVVAQLIEHSTGVVKVHLCMGSSPTYNVKLCPIYE